MKIIYLFVIICIAPIIAQDTVKQITNFNFDSRNPVFLQYPGNMPWFSYDPELFFEGVRNDSLTSLYSLKYDEVSDSFYQLTKITPDLDSNIIQRNAAGKFVENYSGTPYKLLLWETNENGNWDIAFSIDSGNGWSRYGLIFSSLEDELDPSFIVDLFNYDYQNEFQFLYSKGNSIFLCSKKDSIENELIFEGNDSIKYSKPTGAFADYDGTLYAVAVEEKNGNEPHIVYRKRSNFSWGGINYVFDRAPSTNPKFVTLWWETCLSFEVLFGRNKKILLIYPQDFGVPGTTTELLDNPALETSDFSSFAFGIITETPEDFDTYFPYAFKFVRNDSTFIRVGVIYYYLYPYLDFFTNVINSKPAIGPLAYIYEGVVSYTVWEDSSNGKINLFGLRRLTPIGAVEVEQSLVKDFTLSQNYPNPFNPTTKIQYELNKRQYITIKVFDLLGREVATLINEEKQPGVYEVEFTIASTITQAEFIFISCRRVPE